MRIKIHQLFYNNLMQEFLNQISNSIENALTFSTTSKSRCLSWSTIIAPIAMVVEEAMGTVWQWDSGNDTADKSKHVTAATIRSQTVASWSLVLLFVGFLLSTSKWGWFTNSLSFSNFKSTSSGFTFLNSFCRLDLLRWISPELVSQRCRCHRCRYSLATLRLGASELSGLLSLVYIGPLYAIGRSSC